MPAVRFARAWARPFVFAALTLTLNAHLAGAQAPAGKPAEKPAEKPVEKPAEKPAEKAPEKPATGTSSGGEWKIDADTFEGLRARALGPGIMSGRIACIDGVPGERNTLWVGTAGGGVWRSRDNGTTWRPVLDGHAQGIGAIRVAPSDPKIVWVGAGETWARNSVGYGDGVYKTTDGGDSWTKMGLEKTERIARILVHPTRPDTVLVAATGPLFNDSPERGVYRTTDGGKTWTKTLYVDPRTGAADLAMDPQNPDVIYAAMWSVRRQAWTFASGGPGSGLYKSTDGGRTWRKLTKGLPEGDLGRIGISVSPARASRVYALVEAKKTALYISDDCGESWQKGNDSSQDVVWRPFYFANVVADPKKFDRVYKGGLNMSASEDGGRTFSVIGGQGGGTPYHSDMHAIWIDPKDTEWLVIGTDGGVYISSDRGNTWIACPNIPVGQFYHVSYDMRVPYNVYGGLQDNGTWSAPSTRSGGVPNRMWESLLGGDGFWAFPDAKDQDVVYCEYQGGHVSRVRLSTGETKDVQPLRGAGDPKLRFNWNAPLHVGPSGALYMGAQFLYRTRDMGDTWEKLSQDLSTNDSAKLQQDKSGGLSIDNSSAENHCTVYAIGESPKDPNIVWVGTDDGNLQVTRDGGKSWTNTCKALPGLKPCTWISYVDPSPHDPGTCFVTADGHMLGDFAPHVFVTRDFGKSWTALADPAVMTGYAHVVRQDPVNPDLVFVGTEWGLYASLDGGKQWAQVKAGIPNVAVRDLAIQPREGDLLVATHGRGIYVIDDLSPLRSLTRDKLAAEAAFLGTRPNPLVIPRQEQRFSGSTGWSGDELPEAAIITYYLKKRHLIGDLRLEVFDESGKKLATINGGRRRGINRVEWPMRLKGPKLPPAANLVPNQFASVGPRAAAGTYTAKLTKNKDTFTTTFTLVADPRSTHTAADRAEQVKLVNRLYDRLGDLTYTVEGIQAVRDSARARAKALGKDALATKLSAFADRLDAFRGTLVAAREGGRLTGEERLREQLGDLYGKVNGYDGRPTNGQIALAGVLEAELKKGEAEFQAMLAKDLPPLNNGLKGKKLPEIARESREAWDKRSEEAARGSGGLDAVRDLMWFGTLEAGDDD